MAFACDLREKRRTWTGGIEREKDSRAGTGGPKCRDVWGSIRAQSVVWGGAQEGVVGDRHRSRDKGPRNN